MKIYKTKKGIFSILIFCIILGCIGFIILQKNEAVTAYALDTNEFETIESVDKYSVNSETINTSTYKVILNRNDGSGGSTEVFATYNAPMPSATAPTKYGYTFMGYYSQEDGEGTKYYNSDMSSAHVWDIVITDDNNDDDNAVLLYAYWQGIECTVTFYKDGGTGGSSEVKVRYGSPMPSGLIAPTKTGYTFAGYDESLYGISARYYDNEMVSAKDWDKIEDTVLYAKWDRAQYKITFKTFNDSFYEYIYYGDEIDIDWAPSRAHYEFAGYYDEPDGKGTKYIGAEVSDGPIYMIEPVSEGKHWREERDLTLYAYWVKLTTTYSYEVSAEGEGTLSPGTIDIESGVKTKLSAPVIEGYIFKEWRINGTVYPNNTEYTFELHRSYVTGEITIYHYIPGTSATYSDGYLAATYTPDPNCIAAGTMITLADGTQKPVEQLTGNEMLLVWNMYTGTFDVAPILFIDHDPAAMYKIINLYFSDGTHVKVIDEHAFWDINLNKYVFLREDAGQYIGHWFNKQTVGANGVMTWTSVQLTNVTITTEYTTVWSPVTYGHLCYYVNGMLSMPGATEGLINIFTVDGEAMKYDSAQFATDIATYGLFTYEEFAAIYPVPEEIFNAFNAQYLKVSIGKGLITYEELGNLISRYSEFFY